MKREINITIIILFVLLFSLPFHGKADEPPDLTKFKIRIFSHIVYTDPDPNNIEDLKGRLSFYVNQMMPFFIKTYHRVNNPYPDYTNPWNTYQTDISIRWLNPDSPDLIEWQEPIGD